MQARVRLAAMPGQAVSCDCLARCGLLIIRNACVTGDSPRPICGRAPQLALCKTCLGCEKRRSRRTGGPDGDGDDAMPGACVVCWRDLSEGGKAAGAEAGRQCSTCKGAEVASEAAAEPKSLPS